MNMHLEVRLYSGNDFTKFSKHEVVSLYRHGQEPQNPHFISISEYDGIMIEFISNDPTAKLYVDHFIRDEEVELLPGGKEILAGLKEVDNKPSPGYYGIKVQSSKGLYESLYLVEGKHLDWSHIRSLRSYLESKVSGLSYDLLRRRSGMWEGEHEIGEEWFNIYRRLIKHAPTLRKQLELILEDPIDTIERIYVLTNFSRHPDRVSQRWLNQKGQTDQSYDIAKFYEAQNKLTVQNQENTWLVIFLNKLRRAVKDILTRFGKYDELKEHELQQLQERISAAESELANIQKVPYYASAMTKKMKDTLAEHKQAKQKYETRKSELQQYQKNRVDLERIDNYISRILSTSWLSELKRPVKPVQPTLRMQRDARYGALLKLERDLRDNTSRDSSARKQVYPYRSTEKLLEVYVICLLCEILQSLDWVWTQGWVGGFESEIPTVHELLSGEKIVFQKKGYRISMEYEPKLQSYVQPEHVGFEATNHNFPDVLLSIFDEQGRFIKAMVIEVKHRHRRYLIHPQLSTDVMEQLKGYTYIRYHEPDGPINTGAIDRVLCIYPKQEYGSAYEQTYGKLIRFIQIQPCESPKEHPFGFKHLLNEVSEFCNKHLYLEAQEIE